MSAMKLFLVLLFTLVTSSVLHAQLAQPAGISVEEAQARVADLNQKLNDASFRLNLMKIDWQKDLLTQAMVKAKANGDEENRLKFEAKIADLDHRRSVETQRHDLNDQILLARQQQDQSKVDSLTFQLKELQ
jgi:hypothetical protein